MYHFWVSLNRDPQGRSETRSGLLLALLCESKLENHLDGELGIARCFGIALEALEAFEGSPEHSWSLTPSRFMGFSLLYPFLHGYTLFC